MMRDFGIIVLCSLLIAGVVQMVSAQNELIISEVDYDQPGLDNMEWIEITNLREGLFFVTDVHLVLYDADPNGACAEYCRVDLSPLVAIPGGTSIVIGQHSCALLSLCDSVDAIQNRAPGTIVLEHLGNVIDGVEYGSSLNPSVCNFVPSWSLTSAVDSDTEIGSLQLRCWQWGFKSTPSPCVRNPCTPTNVLDVPSVVELPWNAIKSLYR